MGSARRRIREWLVGWCLVSCKVAGHRPARQSERATPRLRSATYAGNTLDLPSDFALWMRSCQETDVEQAALEVGCLLIGDEERHFHGRCLFLILI